MNRRLLGFIAVSMIETAVYSTVASLLLGLVDCYGLSKAAAGVLLASYAFGTLALSLRPRRWPAGSAPSAR